jgi:hypothetical protein
VPDASQQPRAVPCDYDTDPGRWAANQVFRPPGADVSGLVTQWIIAAAAAFPVLELGGGAGPLARELAGHGVSQVVVADLAEGPLSQAPRPAVRTDARAIRSWLRCCPAGAGRAAQQVRVPLRLTKRGTLIWARRPA